MDKPDVPLVSGHWQYTRYVSTEKLIMPEVKREHLDSRTNLGFRMRRRKELIGRRTRATDISFFLAVLGIIVVIIDTELQFSGVLNKESPASVYLRIVTSVATAGLLCSILAYHLIGVQLRLVSLGLCSWKLAVGPKDLVKLSAELIVCAFHPLPVDSAHAPMLVAGDSDDMHAFHTKMIPLNSIFTILMFLRIYLLGRFIVVHSALYCDTTVQSLGAMSNVNINAQFVFKALMTSMPGICLISIMGTTLFVNSYSLRMCEYYTLDSHTDTFFMQAVWMTCVTFLTLGYGDVVPRTTCGRVLAIGTGMMGVGIMALCVAVLTRKLEQTRGEKYVHTFVQQIQMDKKHKDAAARVITHAVYIYGLQKRGNPPTDPHIIKHRRKLLRAVRTMKGSQFLQTHFAESLIGPVEVSKNVSEIFDITDKIQEDQETLNNRMCNMEQLLKNMHSQLYELRDFLKEREKRVK